jgi:hypothetical protein
MLQIHIYTALRQGTKEEKAEETTVYSGESQRHIYRKEKDAA